MLFSTHHQTRTLEIGREIFEKAHKAEPSVVEMDYWSTFANNYMIAHDPIKVPAFQFVDVLPSLSSCSEIARILKEYLDPNRISEMPWFMKIGLAYENPESLYARLLGFFSRFGAGFMAGRFICGKNANEAIKTVLALRKKNMGFTMDILGESTQSVERAEACSRIYTDLVDALGSAATSWKNNPAVDATRSGNQPRANVSVKLTMLDPHFDPVDPEGTKDRIFARLRPILRMAMKRNAVVNIDMESYPVRNLTLDLFESLFMEPEFRDWDGAGIVIQAYLQDGPQDLDRLLDWVEKRGTPIIIRLVKGAYWDSETAKAAQWDVQPPVWTRKWETDACYETMARKMLRHSDIIRPAFASHNVRTIASIITHAEELDLSSKDFELQMLYGMGNPLKEAVAQMGQNLRIYCPFGEQLPGMAYLIRRLLENTCNDSFLRVGFGDRANYDRMLADPSEARPPSQPLPTPRFADPDDEELPMSTFQNVVPLSFNKLENREKMQQALTEARNAFGQDYPLIINGERITTPESIDSCNPAKPSEIIGRCASATTEHADAAIEAARNAWDEWRHMPAAERGQILQRAANLMLDRRLELCTYSVLETGMPWREAEGDVREGIDYINYYADYMTRVEQSPRRRNLPGEDNIIAYEPRGVCVVLAPWSFPVAILTNMTAAALAAGNTVILKPSCHGSIVAAHLVDIFHEAGLPRGVLNFLPGKGSEIGPYLVEHKDVNVIACSGSTETGVDVIRRAGADIPGREHIKKVIANMGANNAIIVDQNCDMDGALKGIIESSFAYAGQKPTACTRVIVHEIIYEEFCKKLAEATQSVRLGPAEDPSTICGPVIDKESRDAIRAIIDSAKKNATALLEWDASNVPTEGYYIPPTIIRDVTPDADIAQNEVFGPVIGIIRASSFDHALEIANSSRFALTGGVYSRSPANIEKARREFHVGNLYINRKITGSRVNVQPYGGYKLSGMGAKSGSSDYVMQFVHQRSITENTLRHGLTPNDEEEE